MAEAATAAAGAAAALLPGLPDEIVAWEILARLPAKPLLRCRAVCRAWRRATSARGFLLAHHARQPSLPVLCGFEKSSGHNKDVLAFDHRAAAGARLQPVARLDNDDFLCLQASCDGLLVLSAGTNYRPSLSVCNPATRQRGILRQPRDAALFNLLGIYLHRPSGEHRLLLYRTSSRASILGGDLMSERKVGCFVSALGSDDPPRHIGGPEAASALGFDTPALVRDSLHWSPVQAQQQQGKIVVAFDTAAESFRQIPAPNVSTKPYIFEVDGKLGIYTYDDAMKVVDIWVLPSYEGEVWEYRHRVKLPVAEIRGRFGSRGGRWDVRVVSTDGIVLLLLGHGQRMFYVDVDGKLVDSFRRDGQELSACGVRLKETLVPHTFFAALEDYAVNASPFML